MNEVETSRSLIGPRPVVLRLSAYLSARLAPLVVILFVVVTLSAPSAYYAVGVSDVGQRVKVVAHDVAGIVRKEIRARPMLWKYDRQRLTELVRAHGVQEGIEAVVILDAEGKFVLPTGEITQPREDLVWREDVVKLRSQKVAGIWVAASIKSIRDDAIFFLWIFALLGAALSGSIYFVASRAMGRAEARIGSLIMRLRASRKALSNLNRNLENEVDERSSQLREALSLVRERERRNRDISARLLNVQETERRALSRELHDSGGQSLTAIRIHLEILRQKLQPDKELKELTQRTLEMADSTLEEMRRIVDRLAPPILGDLGLEKAVLRQCDDLEERVSLRVNSSIHLQENLDPAIELACYRIVQESFTNIMRHSDATEVQLRLEELRKDGERGLEIDIRDNGRGFEMDDSDLRRRRGLLGMSERVELLGGEIRIESHQGEGAQVWVWLPLTKD